MDTDKPNLTKTDIATLATLVWNEVTRLSDEKFILEENLRDPASLDRLEHRLVRMREIYEKLAP